MQIGRPIVEAMRILGSYLPTMDDVRDLLNHFNSNFLYRCAIVWRRLHRRNIPNQGEIMFTK